LRRDGSIAPEQRPGILNETVVPRRARRLSSWDLLVVAVGA
jgi:hypothetical protein